MNVLVSGTSGFVGKVWLGMALEHFPGWHFTLLVRGGVQRFERIVNTSPGFRPLRARHGTHLGAWLSERITVVDADLAEPIDRAAIPIPDCTVHFAGLTDFDPDPARAIAVNIEGAVRMAELAGEAPLLHLSTCYVAGNVGDAEVPETLNEHAPNGAWLDPHAELAHVRRLCEAHKRRAADRIHWVKQHVQALGYPNIYTWSKAVAERLVREQKPDAVFVRPAIVECARHFPFTGWNEGVNTSAPITWLCSSAFRELPAQPEYSFDIVPVDSVARAVLAIATASLRGEAEGVYQLGTSATNPLSFDRVVELNALATRKHHPERWTRHLDPGVLAWKDQPLWRVENLRTATGVAKRVLGGLKLPGAAGDLVGNLHRQVNQADRTLRRVEVILELFKPFIHDNNWRFRADRIESLPPAAPGLEWDAPQIDWRQYWVDVQYLGLWTWSIPALLGQSVPEDPPSGIRLHTRGAEELPEVHPLPIEAPGPELHRSAK